MRASVAVVIALCLATVPLVHASEPGDLIVPAETPVGTYYLVVDECTLERCIFSVWLYEETNGEPGLQRCDDEWFDEGDPHCEPDTVLL